MKRPRRGDATRLKAWPNHNHGDPPMVEAASPTASELITSILS